MINTLSVCSPNARLACLVHDVGKIYTKEQTNTFNFSKEWADIIINENLGTDGLYFPKNIVEQTKRIVGALDFDKRGLERKKNVKYYIRENKDVFEQVCDLKDAIALENTDFTQKSKIARRWRKIYNKMKEEKTPMIVPELALKGENIIEEIPNIKIGTISGILNYCLDFCLYHPRCNDRVYLINKVKKIVNKNPEYYLDV